MNAAMCSQTRTALFSSIFVSNWCDGRSEYDLRRFSMMSCAVLVAEQNYGGDSHHSVWRQLGTTILMSSILVILEEDGIAYQKFQALSCEMIMRQKPSLISIFANADKWLCVLKTLDQGMIVLLIYTVLRLLAHCRYTHKCTKTTTSSFNLVSKSVTNVNCDQY